VSVGWREQGVSVSGCESAGVWWRSGRESSACPVSGRTLMAELSSRSNASRRGLVRACAVAMYRARWGRVSGP
jgi:hypothetical protein